MDYLVCSLEAVQVVCFVEAEQGRFKSFYEDLNDSTVSVLSQLLLKAGLKTSRKLKISVDFHAFSCFFMDFYGFSWLRSTKKVLER